MYEVIEIFRSIQGEGPTFGSKALFIRFAGCNLRCSWCDSKYSWSSKRAKSMTAAQIAAIVEGGERIVLTGGEPLLQDLVPLLRSVRAGAIEIETNGTLSPTHIPRKFDVQFNVSPKKQHIDKDILTEFNRRNSIFKFVIQNRSDYAMAKRLTKELKLKKVVLMPEGITREGIIKRTRQITGWLIADNDFNALVIPRLHIILWGNKRGV
jgi:organic radical activating enzyme